jgi:hypothetical protein
MVRHVHTAMLALNQCSEAPGLEDWIRQSVEPYFSVGPAMLTAAALETVLREIPLLLDPDPESACVWSGRLGEVVCWQLHDAAGQLISRLATAPKPDLSIPQAMVKRHPLSYHQSGIGAGPSFHEQHGRTYDGRALRDGPHFNGYIVGDDLVGCLNIGRGTRLFYVVGEFPGARVVDYDGYWDGEALLARLAFVGDS